MHDSEVTAHVLAIAEAGKADPWTRAMRRSRVCLVSCVVPLALGAWSPSVAASQGPPPIALWQPSTFRVGGASPVLTTTRVWHGTTAYLAWIDHTRTRLALYPGTEEPRVARPRGLGVVPPGQRWRLLATFNGGFKSVSQAGGFAVNGRVSEPLLHGLGTLVEYRDASVGILDWQGRTQPSQLVLARQNLPPLVWGGRVSPAVADYHRWGLTYGGGAAVWRTAIGVTNSGDLVYAAAAGQTPATLAQLMVSVGALRAIQLDINPQVATFISYRSRGARSPLPLVANPMQTATRYLTPDRRDFFAVYTRAGGGAFVPFR